MIPHVRKFKYSLDKPHCARPRDQFQSTLYNWRIDHLRSQRDHAQPFSLGFVISRNDIPRPLNFGRRRRESLMDNWNLQRVHASHAFKTHDAGTQGPCVQALDIADIAKYRINGLHAGSMSGIHYSLPRE
jgi:hypothetical protein